jgi:hypothetical protein
MCHGVEPEDEVSTDLLTFDVIELLSQRFTGPQQRDQT